MFKKVLIANRGEIAVRIMRTLREMGIGTVAIHSEPDTRAMHVRAADEARCLGGSEPRENYLDIEAIIAAVKDTGADAVHPGYGFLSENPELPKALQAAGIAFIGPPADVLRRVGNKTEARRMMRDAEIPIIPGMDSPSDDPELIERAAAEIGFPVLVKAAAGGGGKGMRVVDEPSQLILALQQAQSEAEAAFGDGSVYLERYLRRPRHVEVQVLADGEGNTVHLLERECSIQRRHQKIIEECPSPALDEKLRQRMGEAAVAAAKAAGYVNAGTVEFLLDESGEFYFLEVNARLQVEHPVTELVTGLDLVRWQLRIASGESLDFTQDDIRPRGHAIECRIYAEDPSAGFAPSPGRIRVMRAPSGPGVRFDEGVRAGSDVPTYYDPILAKLVVWAEDRPAAIERMLRALASTTILGVRTAIEFMSDLIATADFREGHMHTAMAEDFQTTWRPSPNADELAVIAAIAKELTDGPSRRPTAKGTAPSSSSLTPWQRLGRWDVVSARREKG